VCGAIIQRLRHFYIQVTEYLLDHQRMYIRHIPVSNACRAAFAVQIGFPADLSMLAITSNQRIDHMFLFLSQNTI
jgi:hypothetical protein